MDEEQRPLLRVKLGAAGVTDPDSLPWPLLAEYIEGVYLSDMDAEGRASFRELLLGEERVDARKDKIRERGQREGWNEFKLGMELELAGVEDQKRRKAIQLAWRKKVAASGGQPQRPRGVTTPSPEPQDAAPVKQSTPVGDGKGRRVFEVEE